MNSNRPSSSLDELVHDGGNVSIPSSRNLLDKRERFRVQERDVRTRLVRVVMLPANSGTEILTPVLGSENVSARGSPNTVAASRNETLCFRIFEIAFSASHSNLVIGQANHS